MNNDLSMFFQPKSIAIIGASRNPKKAGYGILKNVLWTFPHKDRIYAVNPSADEILGQRVYPSIVDIPGKLDLSIMFVEPKSIPELLKQCYEKGVRGIIIESAGFAEVGNQGNKIQEKIAKLGKQFNIRIWGGNCMGTVTDELITTFEPFTDNMRIKGNVSIVGQSGYFSGAVILQLFSERKVGIRKACSIGNRIDINECDLLIDFLADDKTKVAAFYLEGFKNPRKFLQIAKKAKKPIICLLGGQSIVGRKAAFSHTSSTARGSPQLLSDLLKQAGVIQVEEFGEFFDVVEAFSKLPLPLGNRLAIVTITGAGGVIAADISARYNIEIPEFSTETTKKLQEIFPSWMPPQNPVDSWPAFELHGLDKALRQIIPIIFESNEIDMIILMVACMSVATSFNPQVVLDMQKYHKTLISYFVGDKSLKENWSTYIQEGGGVVYDDIKTCIKVLAILCRWSKDKIDADH